MKTGLVVVSILGLVGCPTQVDQAIYAAPNAQQVLIGLLTTDPPQQAGESSEREYAAMLAVSEINAAGGVNGQSLALVLRYDENRPEAGVQAVQNLAQQGIVALIGPAASRVTLPVAQQVTIPVHLPLISFSATSAEISTLHDEDTVYRLPPVDSLQGRLLANKIYAEGAKTLAIAYVDDSYGRGLNEVLQSSFQQLGGQVLTQVALPIGSDAVSATTITALVASGQPDALVVVDFPLASTSLIRQWFLQLGQLPRLYGVDANFKTGLVENLVPQAQGMRGTIPTAWVDNPYYQRFANAYQQRVGKALTTPIAAATYDAVYLSALAMVEAGANTRTAIGLHLRSVSRPDSAQAVKVGPEDFAQAVTAIHQGQDIDYQGAIGPIDFDSNGDPATGFYSYQQVTTDADGQLQLVEIARLGQ